jgi:hypothetical protein
MSWIQRPAHTSLGPSPDVTMHDCLDALIVFIRETRAAMNETWDTEGGWPWRVGDALLRAEERAAICAGLLFDRWIEERDEYAVTILCTPADARVFAQMQDDELPAFLRPQAGEPRDYHD